MDYLIKIDEFEGPLDLLLHLIKKDNINIEDIRIEKITEQYLNYINAMESMNLNIASSYLVMACELLEIKSKSLLPIVPKNDDEVEEVTEETLINKLIEYNKYKELVTELKTMENNRREYLSNNGIILEFDNEEEELITYDVKILTNALFDLLNRINDEPVLETSVEQKEFNIVERKKTILNYLNGVTDKKVCFIDLFDIHTKSYIIVTFLAILDLAKSNRIVITDESEANSFYIKLKEYQA